MKTAITLAFVVMVLAFVPNWKSALAVSYANPIYQVSSAETNIVAKVGGCDAHTEQTRTDIVFFDDGSYVAQRESGLSLSGRWYESKLKTSSVFYLNYDDASKEKILSDFATSFVACGSNLIEPSVVAKRISAKVKNGTYTETVKFVGRDVDSQSKIGGFKSKTVVTGTIENL